MDYSVYMIAILVAALVIWRRARGMYRPIRGNGSRLIWPMLFLIPSLLLIFGSKAHAPAWEWGAALAIGCLLSVPLIITTNFERRDDQQIYAVKNIGFFVSFLGVLVIRFLLRDYLSSLDQETMAALFMTVLVGYVVPWRTVSYLKFRKLYLDGEKKIDFVSK
ncbi:cytochrome c biogenesis protein CcdC [Cohnella cholangitidis]|uniref:Cytochrome c biogenesis protein CcdC n=1 Tax=Cohnella cholangitidis TaxID=2598458 RepID=A0A7G5BXW7_9BACL|nr:cytochrome c biogenesis protein CcdC [Cohnella cholangitidis]QMV41801.1 cytochrome c biogenesis protein CcdC [Cohnella cholangitidis]